MKKRESFTEGQGDEAGAGRSRRSYANRFDKKKNALSDTEDQALISMSQQGAEDAVEVLLLRYRGLVKSIAACICRKTSALHSSYEDLTQEGMIGLWEAVMRYKPFDGVVFQSYAGRRIRGAIYDAIRQNSNTARGDVRKIVRVERVRTTLSRELLREPTTHELRSALPEELQGDLDRIREEIERSSSVLECKESTEQLDAVPCGEEWLPEYRVLSGEEERARSKFTALILRCVPRVLSPSERSVFTRRIYCKSEKPMKLARVGNRIGVTESRACQLNKEIPVKLLRYMRKYHQKEVRAVLEFVQ